MKPGCQTADERCPRETAVLPEAHARAAARPPYCVFATHYADVVSFEEVTACWDKRASERNLAKALGFSRIYVDFIRTQLGPNVQIVFVDSSPLDIAGFLRRTFPQLSVEESGPTIGRRSLRDLVCIKFPDNIGHLSVHGRDGWGRACMKGLEYCMAADYEFAVHVEADLLVKGCNWVSHFVDAYPNAGIIAPRMHLGLETGLFIARTSWLRQMRFVERYNWQAVRNRPRPEARFAAIAGREWAVMPIGGGRGEAQGVGSDAVRAAKYFYLTHALPQEWRAFLEASDYPVPPAFSQFGRTAAAIAPACAAAGADMPCAPLPARIWGLLRGWVARGRLSSFTD